MSRGLSRRQRDLQGMLIDHGQPMTFDEICAAILRDTGDKISLPTLKRLAPSFLRSLRRSLHTMVRDQQLLAIGAGGPGEPFKYYLHPLTIEIYGNQDDKQQYYKTINETPGGNLAMTIDGERFKELFLRGSEKAEQE
jgi:hypothetical protein